jgi:Na+-transporting NADH:ubiquinone oxidoreductase subunit NqrE
MLLDNILMTAFVAFLSAISTFLPLLCLVVAVLEGGKLRLQGSYHRRESRPDSGVGSDHSNKVAIPIQEKVAGVEDKIKTFHIILLLYRKMIGK